MCGKVRDAEGKLFLKCIVILPFIFRRKWTRNIGNFQNQLILFGPKDLAGGVPSRGRGFITRTGPILCRQGRKGRGAKGLTEGDKRREKMGENMGQGEREGAMGGREVREDEPGRKLWEAKARKGRRRMRRGRRGEECGTCCEMRVMDDASVGMKLEWAQ